MHQIRVHLQWLGEDLTETRAGTHCGGWLVSFPVCTQWSGNETMNLHVVLEVEVMYFFFLLLRPSHTG